MNDIIFVHKQAGAKKDAVRVSSIADIPEFLKGAVRVNGDTLEIECVEGNETANLGEVIGYEKSEKTSSGYNCWVIGNAETNLIEKDGVFYKKATVMKAAQVTEDSIKINPGQSKLIGENQQEDLTKLIGFCMESRKMVNQMQTFLQRLKSHFTNISFVMKTVRIFANCQNLKTNERRTV